jgi:hypothetical protein
MAPTVDEILACLNRRKTRATYGAVGALLHRIPRSVGRLLGPRRRAASWVVTVRTGKPSGYEKGQIHRELAGSPLIDTGERLLELLAQDRRTLR